MAEGNPQTRVKKVHRTRTNSKMIDLVEQFFASQSDLPRGGNLIELCPRQQGGYVVTDTTRVMST